jgi:hypothetical protein
MPAIQGFPSLMIMKIGKTHVSHYLQSKTLYITVHSKTLKRELKVLITPL